MVSRSLIRLTVLSTVLLFSVIVLGLAASVSSTTQSLTNFESNVESFTGDSFTGESFPGVQFPYASLAIATAVITMVTVGPMIGLEIFRPGGITSMVIFEINSLFLLWVLWLATAAESVQADTAFNQFSGFGLCSNSADNVDNIDNVDPFDNGLCAKTSALEAFAFLNWIILMVYAGTLLFLSVVAANRNHKEVWKSSVAQAPFFVPASGSAAGTYGGSSGKATHQDGTSVPGTVQTGAMYNV
ncbi:hypothetical protein B0H11DRAFT_2104998 [Mycena galericulata]|nr:hypothetical protein B0H11DRAFT_2104998 [Mycena galericulata]